MLEQMASEYRLSIPHQVRVTSFLHAKTTAGEEKSAEGVYHK